MWLEERRKVVSAAANGRVGEVILEGEERVNVLGWFRRVRNVG